MDILITITEYKHHMQAIGYAPKTIESYSWGLDEFRDYLQRLDIQDLRNVTHQMILDYQANVMSQPLARESKAIKIRPVKRLFEHLTEAHKLLINPTEGIIETCRVNRKTGIVLTFKEMQTLLDQPNLSLRIEIRDRAVMELMYATAIRIDEFENLEVYHADLRDKVLYIAKAKGRKQRVVPLGDTAARYLREYLENIRPRYAKKNKRTRALFLSINAEPMTAGAVRLLLKKYRRSANIKKPVTPHTFRRTCATHMLQNGADIRYIQKLLGHKHLSTTQLYTKVLPVDVKKIHTQTHPGVDIETGNPIERLNK